MLQTVQIIGLAYNTKMSHHGIYLFKRK